MLFSSTVAAVRRTNAKSAEEQSGTSSESYGRVELQKHAEQSQMMVE